MMNYVRVQESEWNPKASVLRTESGTTHENELEVDGPEDPVRAPEPGRRNEGVVAGGMTGEAQLGSGAKPAGTEVNGEPGATEEEADLDETEDNSDSKAGGSDERSGGAVPVALETELSEAKEQGLEKASQTTSSRTEIVKTRFAVSFFFFTKL